MVKTKILYEKNFTKEYCPEHWRPLGTSTSEDHCVEQDGDGLTVNTHEYKDATPRGPNGWLDYFKTSFNSKYPIELEKCCESIFEAKISVKQYFDMQSPVPEAYLQRTQDIYADPRFSNGHFGVIDPDSGLWAGFLLTDHALYAVYGILPNTAVCEYLEDCKEECQPCKTACDVIYTQGNFFSDQNYRTFKQNTSFETFEIFTSYTKWYDHAKTQGLSLTDWDMFVVWQKKIGCPPVCFPDWVSWKTTNDYIEYCMWKEWDCWYKAFVQWKKCNPNKCIDGNCEEGYCSSKYWGTNGGACAPGKPGCFHMYGKSACYYDEKNAANKESFSYQFNAIRDCCCKDPASFIEVIPIARTEACDPLCDFQKVAIGINTKTSTITFYHNQQCIYKVVGIGRRLNDEYRVVEHGGYAQNIYPWRVLTVFGTGSMLDAAMVENYSRSRVNPMGNKLQSALVPLMNRKAYFNPYFDQLGQLTPALKNNPEYFANIDDNPAYKVFGQGAVFKILYIHAFTGSSSCAYYPLPDLCKNSLCCGESIYGPCYLEDTCVKDWEDDGCCDERKNCYGSDDISDRGCFDPRNYKIIRLESCPPDSQVGPDEEYILVRRPINKRYWQRNNNCDNFGYDPLKE